MKKKSIGMNAGLNAIKTIFSIIFPLITLPYVTRVLHVENLGIYNFCSSVVSYFTLTAGLGISTYAVREGARYRENQDEFNEFASETFSINLISTIVSYVVFFILISFVPRLHQDASVLSVLGLSIIFTTLGCEWVFNVYEEFGYLALRSIVFQIVSLILLILFVRSEKDLIPYAAVTVISNSGANIVNMIARRKYCKIRFVINRKMIQRLVPILFLFANSVATSIYTNSDTTMIGIMVGNRATGLYSVSVKVYSMVKQLLAALIIVSIPRLSAYLGKNDYKSFRVTSNKIFNALIVLVVPAMVGLFALSKNVILILSGSEYLDAVTSLRILSIGLFFSIFSWFYTSCILIPNRGENKVLIATIAAAAVNIGLNFFLIPVWAQNAAAVTTAIAEFLSMVICIFYGRSVYKASVRLTDMISVAAGCFAVYVICVVANILIKSLWGATILSVGLSILAYVIILKLTKNKSYSFVEDMVKSKLKRK